MRNHQERLMKALQNGERVDFAGLGLQFFNGWGCMIHPSKAIDSLAFPVKSFPVHMAFPRFSCIESDHDGSQVEEVTLLAELIYGVQAQPTYLLVGDSSFASYVPIVGCLTPSGHTDQNQIGLDRLAHRPAIQ